MPESTTTKRPPPQWLRHGISAFVGAITVLLGTVATASVDWKEAEITERQMLAGGFTQLYQELRLEINDLRAQVNVLEEERAQWRLERDSLEKMVADLTDLNRNLQYRVYWLERQMGEQPAR